MQLVIDAIEKYRIEYNYLYSCVSASTETRLPCFDENLHIVWQKGQVTSATDRDIPEA